MKKMTKKEREELFESWAKEIDEQLKSGKWNSLSASTYASGPTQPISHPKTSLPPLPVLPGMSPTDVDAKGMYPYQQPEMDEQGTYYGYKILRKCCDHKDCHTFYSPRFSHARWENGELEADNQPSKFSMFGIHFTKRPDHPELRNYIGSHYPYNYHNHSWEDEGMYVLVKCALSGDVVIETEQGFRAQHAQIIGVYENGNWTSYQDYQERARSYSRPNPEPWQASWRLSYGKPPKGSWTTYPDFSSDS